MHAGVVLLDERGMCLRYDFYFQLISDSPFADWLICVHADSQIAAFAAIIVTGRDKSSSFKGAVDARMSVSSSDTTRNSRGAGNCDLLSNSMMVR